MGIRKGGRRRRKRRKGRKEEGEEMCEKRAGGRAFGGWGASDACAEGDHVLAL